MPRELDYQYNARVDEDMATRVIDSTYHLMFFRDLVRATGLREKALEIGWLYGQWEVDWNWDPWEGTTDHLNRVLAILDAPLSTATVMTGHAFGGPGDHSGFYGDDSPLEEEPDYWIRCVWGPKRGQKVEVTDDDLIVELEGEARGVAALGVALCRQRPWYWNSSALCTFVPTATGLQREEERRQRNAEVLARQAELVGRYMDWQIREAKLDVNGPIWGPKARESLVIVYKDLAYEQTRLYDNDHLFWDLINAWKEDRTWFGSAETT